MRAGKIWRCYAADLKDQGKGHAPRNSALESRKVKETTYEELVRCKARQIIQPRNLP